MSYRKVAGYCPMGCGRTLYLTDSGAVTCTRQACPAPTAVAEILNANEPHHIVVLGADTFSVQHPLRERLDGDLFDCGLHAWIAGLSGPPRAEGRYAVAAAGDGTLGWECATWWPTPETTR